MNFAKLLVVAPLLLSVLVLSSAMAETTPITVDAAAKRNEFAGVEMEIVFKGVGAEGIEFDVAFDTMKMEAPPLQSDLSKLLTLAVDGGAPMRPSSWTIHETGNMGHHLRGRLRFPAEAAGRPVIGRGAKSFELRLPPPPRKAKAVFLWSIVGR